MTTAHTPGPWEVEPYSDGDEVLNVVADYKALPNGHKQAHWIAECDAGLDFGDDAEEVLGRNAANARLIAAAPELLVALKALTHDYELLLGDGITDSTAPPLLKDAHAAIKKAEA